MLTRPAAATPLSLKAGSALPGNPLFAVLCAVSLSQSVSGLNDDGQLQVTASMSMSGSDDELTSATQAHPDAIIEIHPSRIAALIIFAYPPSIQTSAAAAGDTPQVITRSAARNWCTEPPKSPPFLWRCLVELTVCF